MILLDSDILIDLLRRYPPAVAWLYALPADEQVIVSGYVVMELIQGCRNKAEQDSVRQALATHGVAWLAPDDYDKALDVFATYRLSHNAGLLDVLIGQTTVALGAPLCTLNQRHYSFIPGLQTSQTYATST